MPYKWCTIVPVNPHYQDANNCLETSFRFDNGVVFSKAPKWFYQFYEDDYLDNSKKQLIEDTEFTLSIEYEASNLGDPDPEWQGEKPRSIHDKALEQIQHANLALWIAKPSCTGFELVVDAQLNKNKWFVRQARPIDRIVPHVRYKDDSLSIENLVKAKKILSSLTNLTQGAVRLSFITTHWALITTNWDYRYLLLWIALEALFGPQDAREITYRMSQRIAFFLTSDKDEAKKVFKTAKDGYKWRSKIVHGRKLSKLGTEKSEQILYDVEDFIRKSLERILTDNQLLKKFNSNKRELYLNNLVFNK